MGNKFIFGHFSNPAVSKVTQHCEEQTTYKIYFQIVAFTVPMFSYHAFKCIKTEQESNYHIMNPNASL